MALMETITAIPSGWGDLPAPVFLSDQLGRAINARNRAAGVMMPDIITDARAAIFRAMAGGSYASAFG
jgi:hypothetical protein